MGWWKRFLEQLAKENKRVYKGKKPSCCSTEDKGSKEKKQEK